MKTMGSGKEHETFAMVLLKSRGRVKRVGQEIREATTGQVVFSVDSKPAGNRLAILPKVWATAAPVQTPSSVEAPAVCRVKRAEQRPELAFYRKYTEALLRRYVQMSTEAGRVPSLLGKEMFRGKVTSYRVRTFEDVVIFRLDVEKCLRKLDGEERELIRRIAVQEYTQGEAAVLLGMSLRTCVQRYGQAVDRLTGILLGSRMLEPFTECQGGEA